ncbi:MAG: hypothetical protein CL600_07725 [Alteromonas sp.]|nr:hypothetical protein BM528_07930 [Alteromonas sp. RW2A1]MAI64747.1 hypothetical protein [Alteromonas sp.]
MRSVHVMSKNIIYTTSIANTALFCNKVNKYRSEKGNLIISVRRPNNVSGKSIAQYSKFSVKHSQQLK